MFNSLLTAVPKNCDRRGSMLVLIAVVMIIFIVAAAFSVDIAYMHMVKAELRTATDAAAKAGAEALARTQDPEAAIDAALAIAESNRVAGNGLTLNREDVVIGGVNLNPDGKFEFVPGQEPLTSVNVIGRRNESAPDDVVPLFFGGYFGVDHFKPVQDASASSTVRDIALVLDRSGSMAEASGTGTRLTALIEAVNVFIDEIAVSSPNSIVSLTTYSTNATRDIPLSDDFGLIQSNVNGLVADGYTNIFEALRFGSDSLNEDANRRPYADKTIIVMTDGNFNVGGNPTPSAILAADRGHRIHTITFSSGANQAIMQEVASIGNGIHIHADDAGDLADAFRDIAKTLSVVLIK